MEKDEFICADMVLLSSSEPEGLCYVETSNLDGETNLKIKQAHPKFAPLTTPAAVGGLRGHIESEAPNASLYTYTGSFTLASGEKVPVGPEQMLLRGAQLRNTGWVYGLVVVGGKETKVMRNATKAPVKRTAVERQVNKQILFLFLALIALSLASTVGSSIRSVRSPVLRDFSLGSFTPHAAGADLVVLPSSSGSTRRTSGISVAASAATRVRLP